MFRFLTKMKHATFLSKNETFSFKGQTIVALNFISKSFFTFFTCSNQVYSQQYKRKTQQLPDI